MIDDDVFADNDVMFHFGIFIELYTQTCRTRTINKTQYNEIIHAAAVMGE